MIDQTVGHGSTLNPAGAASQLDADLYARPNRSAPGYAEYARRLEHEGCPLNGIPGRPRLIAFCSPAMGSGKSIAARHLVNGHGFVLLKFAGILKEMTRSMLRGVGTPADEIERYIEGDLKETVVPEIGATPRFIMQRLGTEFGRQCIREDLWAHLTQQAAASHMKSGRSVVIDDMRYRNELDKVEEIGGLCVRVCRPGAIVTSTHSSEGELDSVAMLVLTNNGTLDDLRRKTDGLLCFDPARS